MSRINHPLLPNESFFVLKTHLHPMAFAPSSNSTKFQTLLDTIELISSFMALYHKFDFLQFMACENILRSYLALML